MSQIRSIALEKVDFLPADRVTDDASILTLKNLVLEPMLDWQDGQPAPGLFGSFDLSPDGLIWQLRLRPGAVFHDGTPVQAQDAADFLAAILRARDMFGMPWSYARYLEGASIIAEGDLLTITTPKPFPDLPDILSEFYLPRLNAAGQPILGTGPWRVESFTPGVAAMLCHSDGRRLQVLAMPHAEDRLAALQAGRIDATMHLERLEQPRRALPGFSWVEEPITLSVMAYMNGSAGAFAHPAARLAANLAIDRAALIDKVMGGLGLAAKTFVSPWHHGFAEADLAPIPYDPIRARALLVQVPGPHRITLRTPTHMPERAPEIAAFIAKALTDVGFEVALELVEDRPGYARQLGNKQTGDLAIFDSSPHSTFRVADDKISSESRAVWWQGVEDTTADALFETARRALPAPERAAAYGALLAHLQAAPPWLYLFHPIEVLAHVPDWHGLSLTSKGIMRIA